MTDFQAAKGDLEQCCAQPTNVVEIYFNAANTIYGCFSDLETRCRLRKVTEK